MLGRGWFGDIVVRAQTRVGGLFARRMGATLRVQIVAGWRADNGTVLRTGGGFQHALGRAGYSGGFVLGTFAGGVTGWDAQVTGQTSDLCFDFIGQAWSKQMGVGVAVMGAIGSTTGEGDEASKEN